MMRGPLPMDRLPDMFPAAPTPSFVQDSAYTGPRLAPPLDQPVQKSYKDWNTAWPEDSWQITEPGIYYQAAYVYLLSRFVEPLTYQSWAAGHGLTGAATNFIADPDNDGVCNLMEYAFNLSPEMADKSGTAAVPLADANRERSAGHLSHRPVSPTTGHKQSDVYPSRLVESRFLDQPVHGDRDECPQRPGFHFRIRNRLSATGHRL